MKPVRYLLGKIRQYDPGMLWVILLNTLLEALYPFIWVVVPSLILRYAGVWDKGLLMRMIILAGLLAMACGFTVTYFKGNYRMRMNKVRYHLIQDLMAFSLKMPYENTLNPKVLDDIKFANETVLNPQRGAGGIILMMLSLFSGMLASLGFVGVLSTLSPFFTLAMAALFAATFFLSNRADQAQTASWDAAVPLDRRGSDLSDIAKDPLYKKDILLYGTKNLLLGYIGHLREQLLTVTKSTIQKTFRAQALIALLNLLRDAGLYAFLITAFLRGEMDAGGFFLYTGSLMGFMTVAQQAMTNLSAIRREGQRFSSYMRLMEDAPPPETAGVPVPMKGKLEARHLCFRYPGQEEYTLEDVSFQVEAGEKLALVGENGAGKSTLIKLICRLYQPTSGTITLGGVDIWQMPEEEYFARLGVVFQDAMVLPFSLKDNVLMGAAYEDALYQQVCALSHLDKIAEELPEKDGTTLMRILDDDGVDLSGGQKQTLFLARALYKRGAQLLILDEPTAALDPLNERRLYESYAALSQGKNCLFVSHRLASTRFCDRVLFLKEGQVAEAGTHEDLMLKKGEYAALFEVQAKNYREKEGAE